MNKTEFLNSVGIFKRYHIVDTKKIPCFNKIKKYTDNIKNNIKEGNGLLILGMVGVGKTCIISYIAQKIYDINQKPVMREDDNDGYIIQKPYTITSIRVPNLYNLFFKKDEPGTIDKCFRSDILCLDDFGTEYDAQYPATFFENLIETRYAKQQATIITTNFSVEKLKSLKQYERVIDRWREMCQTIIISSKEHKSQRQQGG